MALFKKPEISKNWWEGGEIGILVPCSLGKYNRAASVENSMADPQKLNNRIT